MASKYRISVNLSEIEYKQLQALSEKHQVSMAWFGRKAISEYLQRSTNEELQLPLSLIGTRSNSA